MRALLLLLLAALPAQAQPNPPDTAKYWIFFVEKPADLPPLLARQAALERRALRGTTASVFYDQPVPDPFLRGLEAHGVRPLVASRWLNAVSAHLSRERAAEVAALPFVRGLMPVGHVFPTWENRPPNHPLVYASVAHAPRRTARIDYGASEAQLAHVNAIPPLEAGLNGTGVRFGIIDTEYGGFTHPAFADMVTEGRLVADSNFVGQSQQSRHGLAVASIAFGFDEGSLVGPAYGAMVYAATTEFAPTETNQEEDNLVRALEWMEQEGVDVVNISLGYSTFDAGQQSYVIGDLDGDTGVTTRAVDMAARLGVVVVTSAGNTAGCGTPASCWYYITTPADADSSITVGATTSTGDRASFSAAGPTADGRIKPDVMALGVGVVFASGSGYSAGNGTSFSSPMVAGVVAQMLQANPALSPIEVRDILRQTADRATDPDTLFGWGIIDAHAATQQATLLARERETVTLPFTLDPPYPNPSRNAFTFPLVAPVPLPGLTLRVYNLLGQEVAQPFAGSLPAGPSLVRFAPTGLAPGIYYYVATTRHHRVTGRLALLP